MYLVTGGSGFCGSAIVGLLLSKGEKVRTLDIEASPETIGALEFIKGDIRDRGVVNRACENVDKIIHTAAKVPISKAGKGFSEVNVIGTRNILAAAMANDISKVVHLSSSSVQGISGMPIGEHEPYDPVGPYAKSKMEGEKVCKEFVSKGLNIDIIRPRTTVGKGRLGIFSILFDWIDSNRTIYVIGDGENRLQLLHVDDLASCCYLASMQDNSEMYNIGSAQH